MESMASDDDDHPDRHGGSSHTHPQMVFEQDTAY